MAVQKNKPITQPDLMAFGKQLAERLISQLTVIVKSIVKSEVRAEVRKEVRKEVRASEKRVIKTLADQMEALLENRGSEWLGVTGEGVKLMKDKQQEHEERITTVEERVGLRA